MQFFPLLLLTLSVRVLETASLSRNNWIKASHDDFWSASMIKLRVFFSRLDNIIERVKGVEGVRFSTYIPYTNDPLSDSVSRAINTLNTEKINEILAEGNEKVIEVVLEKGLKYCFEDWSRINLFDIPSHLISSFPIEFLPKEAFSTLNLDSVIVCVLARADERKFKNFQYLISKLDPEFWKDPRIRSNFSLRMLMSGFHLGTFAANQIPNASNSDSLEEVYHSPYCHVLEFIMNLDILKELEKEIPLSDFVYVLIFSQFPFYFYILQTYLHEILTNGQVVNIGDVKLFSFFMKKSILLQETISKRIEKFPLEVKNLTKLKSFFKKRFSPELLNLNSPFFDGPLDEAELVTADEIFQLLSPVINPLNPDLVLNVFIMTTSEEHTSIINSGPFSSSSMLIERIANDFLSGGEVIETFKQNSNLIFSFANCLRRNRFATEQMRRNFGSSSKARSRDVYIVSRILANDFSHLQKVLSENERGIQRQLKFSTIFAGAFADSVSFSHEPESRLHYHMSSNQFDAKIPSNSTWALNQVGTSGKFGLKMKNRIKSNETEMFQYGRKRGFQESETERLALGRKSLLTGLNTSAVSSNTVILPNISFAPTSSDEYFYVNQLKSRRRVEEEHDNSEKLQLPKIERFNFEKLKAECPEIRFIYSILTAIGRSMIFPAENLKFYIEGSSVSGDGILKDSLANFGNLISLPKFKTVEYNEELDGFVPLPLLCPKVMGFLGAWTALCLKHNVPLPWNFASVFREFLFRAVEPENEQKFVDVMIERIFGDLFNRIKMRFEDKDVEYFRNLPKLLKSHRMFNLPQPLVDEAAPFLLETLFLEMQAGENSNSLAPFEESKDLQKYLAFLKYSVKKHLYEGRDEFMKYFSVYFKKNFLQYLKFSLIDEFIRGCRAEPEDVSAALSFNGTANIAIRNDFDGESGEELIHPLDLMKTIVMKLSEEELGKFLWFVTGSSRTPLDGFSDIKLGFTIEKAAEGKHYSRAQVCFKSFVLIIHNRSAKETFKKFVETITSSAGFALQEV